MDTANLFKCLDELENVNRKLKKTWAEKVDAQKFFIDYGKEFTVKINGQWVFVKLDISLLYNSLEYEAIPCLVPESVDWFSFEIRLQEAFLKFLELQKEIKELESQKGLKEACLNQEILKYASWAYPKKPKVCFALQGVGVVYKVTAI